MKRVSALVLALIVTCISFAQLPTPGQFLGYPLGSRFTTHDKIVAYFKEISRLIPQQVKLEQYGLTNEGRPLMVAYVSSSSNMAQLEAIRQRNIDLVTGERAVGDQTPVIVWLSYNVHGNEASSSEVSMQTLYTLANPDNTREQAWLNNTVVIIDPCLNPDGRDRYVNWYNTVASKPFNPDPHAREHDEPWPGGRTNHYNFDLNRDWAWQTQVESQQRLKLFQQWMPQVHVDFHEQYPENPYYFAPAAEPYHEVITPFQRSFQQTIGRNHARYFDQQGWLYFTRQYFDLLYPSYGDTYPIYNGSIGMTYEQAGHGISGLGIRLSSGDTLTLKDRIQHHFTTSMSTLEVASQRATELMNEFRKYFADTRTNGAGPYKSYVIRYEDRDEDRVKELMQLMKKNGIRYGLAKTATVKGYNYETGKEENFTTTANDLVISTFQPKGKLVKVLFEPKAALADSFTYDITAWSMPYAYGLKAWASTQIIPAAGEPAVNTVNNTAADVYGYVIRWNGMDAARLTGQLLQKGIKLRVSDEPFSSGGQSFNRGSVLILKTSNQYVPDLWNTVRRLANEAGVQLTAVGSGFVEQGFDFGSNRIRMLKARKVALLTGEQVSSNAAGEVWYYFEQVLHYPVTLINTGNDINWSDYDVVIMPSGNYRFLNDKSSSEAFRNWVSNGGSVIAIEGAVAQLSRTDFGLKSKKADEAENKEPYAALKRYENREREFLPNVTPGSIFRVELDNSHPLAYGYPKYYYTLKQDDQLYDFIRENGWNVGVIKKDKQVSGFVGSRLQNRLQDGLIFGVQEVGRGTITYLADDVLFRSFWENGKLLMANAVFMVGQ